MRYWKQTAIALGRSDDYVHRIQEITEDYVKGKPLNDNQIDRLHQDMPNYREQVRQVQAQRQRQGGFSL